MRTLSIVTLVTALIAAPVQAQDLAAKIAASRGEKVTFTFAGRDGVCGNGESFNLGRVEHSYSGAGWECREGPVRVTLTRAAQGGARWSRIKTTVASPVPSGAEDLGNVPPADAADWLLKVAESGDQRIGDEAIMPAVVAREVVTWPRLAAMAKKQTLPSEIRKQAIFWLGQEAADEAVGPLEESTDDPESEIRKAAVFALSQQHTDHSIDVLVRVARTHRDKETRRQAFFWLGQSEDPRGIKLFEEVLAGR